MYMNLNEKYYIILVNFNAWKDTVECLESIRESSYKNIQTIIVDNCSQDDSLTLMKKNFDEENIKYISYKSSEILEDNLSLEDSLNDRAVIIIQAEENRGFAAGNNIGIKYAKLKLACLFRFFIKCSRLLRILGEPTIPQVVIIK